MLSFFVAKNLVDRALREGKPWDFEVSAQRLDDVRQMPKSRRRTWMQAATTDWQVYTTVMGKDPGRRVGGDNEAVTVLGFSADYDAPTPMETVRDRLGELPAELQPQFIETTLSRKLRLVWVFERPVPVCDSAHAGAFFHAFAAKLKLLTMLAGYDQASEKPTQVWTNGVEWEAWAKEPVSWSALFPLIVEAGKKARRRDNVELPLDVIDTEIRARFPGRWQGEFKLDALGVRFWDETADNQSGCQVKPDGMLCFTGLVGFMSWASIFGTQWVNDKRQKNLSALASDIYYDGRVYLMRTETGWWENNQDCVVRALADGGLNPIKEKGQTLSDVSRVLHHIEKCNRIHGAAPLIYEKPNTVCHENGQLILNTSTLAPVQPSDLPSTPDDFPFIYSWLKPAFTPHEGHLPFESCMAWLKRSYLSLLERKATMGQALFICGPASSGKTLFAVRVIAPLMGYRMANPYDYLTGKTNFTDNLFGSAYWCINDEENPSDYFRSVMLAKLKSSTVNPVHQYHPKFAKKLSINWQGRIVATLNDDPQSVAMLPEVTESTKDKLCFYSFRDHGFTFPKDTHETEGRITSELPRFARWLKDWAPPPQVLSSSRMGIESYYDPRLLNMSKQQAPAHNLKELLVIWCRVAPEWNGTDTWSSTPTGTFASIENCDVLKGVLKEYTVGKLAKGLRSLALLPDSGVAFVEGTNERMFAFNKLLLNA